MTPLGTRHRAFMTFCLLLCLLSLVSGSPSAGSGLSTKRIRFSFLPTWVQPWPRRCRKARKGREARP